jgi:hypothetical protein
MGTNGSYQDGLLSHIIPVEPQSHRSRRPPNLAVLAFVPMGSKASVSRAKDGDELKCLVVLFLDWLRQLFELFFNFGSNEKPKLNRLMGHEQDLRSNAIYGVDGALRFTNAPYSIFFVGCVTLL